MRRLTDGLDWQQAGHSAVLYARFSPRPNADDCDSIEKQLERERAYCAAMGWPVLAEFRDESTSGDRATREGFDAALDLACAERAVLVIYDLSRLARDSWLAQGVWKRLMDARADLAAVAEGLNTTCGTGRAMAKLVFDILSSLHEFQLGQIRERTRKAMQQYQKSGRRMGRADRLPYGRMADPNDPKRMVDCPEELAMIRDILDYAARGLGYRQIARSLNECGITCRGRPWHDSLVRKICRRGMVKA